MLVKIDTLEMERFQEWVDKIEENHSGSANAYRTLYVSAGVDATVIGGNMQQADFKAVQGAGETRILMAAGVPATVVGSSEGMAGSSLNSGNYAQSRRNFGDRTLRPLWRNWCGSAQSVVTAPSASRLWYDDNIPFLRDDATDAADIRAQDAQTIRTLTDAGFNPDEAVRAVVNDDMSLLAGAHSGLFSVQLQKPGTPDQLTLDTGDA